jgi:hypothetical protein
VNNEKIFGEAVKQWGVDSQVIMAFEEMSELTKALCKLRRNNYRWGDGSPYREQVKEEIADVELMLEQIKYMFEIHDIQDYKILKMDKLRGLLKK